MMRNLGGAIGTATIETFFTKREQYHSSIINAACVAARTRDPQPACRAATIFHGAWLPRPGGGLHRAIIAIGQTIRAQATIMGYADSFACSGSCCWLPHFLWRCSKRAPPPAGAPIDEGALPSRMAGPAPPRATWR